MENLKERVTMPTCTAPMRIDKTFEAAGQADAQRRAFVLVEMLLVLIMVGLMTALAMLNFSSAFTKAKFERQVNDFINVLKMAQNGAAESDKRYAVILNFDEQSYTLRRFDSLSLDVIPDEEAIITTGYFTGECYLDWILFDDFEYAIEETAFEARFYAGHSGWQYGGKIVLLDADGNPYSVVVNRLSRVITLQPGDVEILEPQYQEDVPF
jgi:type II secretory pathway pseudopilin PulG